MVVPDVESAAVSGSTLVSGQAFVDSKDPLVPSATNGQLNVYEYENGKPNLISAGTSECGSYFLDASPDGSNVFFATAKALVTSGSKAVYAIYDARVEGGFAEEAPPATPCEGEECRGSTAPSPVFSVPATVTISEAPASQRTEKKAVKKAKPRRKKRSRRHGSHAKQRNMQKSWRAAMTIPPMTFMTRIRVVRALRGLAHRRRR